MLKVRIQKKVEKRKKKEDLFLKEVLHRIGMEQSLLGMTIRLYRGQTLSFQLPLHRELRNYAENIHT